MIWSGVLVPPVPVVIGEEAIDGRCDALMYIFMCIHAKLAMRMRTSVSRPGDCLCEEV